MSNEIDFLKEAEALSPELQSLREAIHRRPELGNREFETAALAVSRLRAWGIAVRQVTETAVAATLQGALPGPTVALRADMDALPVCERSGAAFASETPGVMHACGHDVHTAALLGAARLLSAHRDRLRGTVRFLFQPDEEGDGGAARMVASGCLTGVEAVFGCHVSPALPLGDIGVRYGTFYAAADIFDLTVRGKSAHGAEREKGVDALGAAASLVCALLELPETVLPARAVLSVGSFHAGTARNVLADRAELQGILRSLGPDTRTRMRQALRETVERCAARSGAAMELDLRRGYDGVVNTDAATDTVRSAAEALLGPAHVHVLQEPTMTTEDFGCLIEAAGAGSFYHVGAGCTAPLHAPDFLPDGRAAVLAAAVHAATVWRYGAQKAREAARQHGGA